MAKAQPFLFENELPEKEQPVGLTLAPQPNRPLTKAQRAFNRLVTRVEELRARIAAETQVLDDALVYYGTHLHPRLQRQNELRKDVVRLLAPFLQKKHLKNKKDRKALRVILSEQLGEIVREDGSLQADDLRAIFRQVHEVDFEVAEREEIEESRSEMKAMLDELGIDIDLSDIRPGMSDVELKAKMAELAATINDKAEEAQRAFRQQKRRKSKRQLEREEQSRQAEEIRKKSIATIYRQLAKALHPDLEPNTGRRERKVVLMQELTAAYRNNDLHTLLRLELQWIQREEGNLENLTEAKLVIYNQALKDQVKQLQQELALLPELPRYQVLAVPNGPFSYRMRTNGPTEARALDERIKDLEATLAQLRSENAIGTVHEIVRAYRAAPPDLTWDDLEDILDVDLPF